MPVTNINLILKSPKDTASLAQALAVLLISDLTPPNKNTIGETQTRPAHPFYPVAPLPLFLDGELGAGKTTLIRELVLASNDSAKADFSSPSFNIYNLYPTQPVIAHADLYRLPEACAPDDDLLELLEDEKTLVIIEWAERMPSYLLPSEYLYINLSIDGLDEQKRNAYFKAVGVRATLILDKIIKKFA